MREIHPPLSLSHTLTHTPPTTHTHQETQSHPITPTMRALPALSNSLSLSFSYNLTLTNATSQPPPTLALRDSGDSSMCSSSELSISSSMPVTLTPIKNTPPLPSLPLSYPITLTTTHLGLEGLRRLQHVQQLRVVNLQEHAGDLAGQGGGQPADEGKQSLPQHLLLLLCRRRRQQGGGQRLRHAGDRAGTGAGGDRGLLAGLGRVGGLKLILSFLEGR